MCLNNKLKGDLSKFPKQSFSQEISCFLVIHQKYGKTNTWTFENLKDIPHKNEDHSEYQPEILKEL
jgi:hypothetical protein